MTPVLSLHLLGPFRAASDDQPLTTFATDKVRALLVFLAMESDIPHRRESLATLLFPDWNDKQAADNLRRTLHRLRSALSQHDPQLSDHLLTITRTTVQLNPSALRLDAAQFRQTLGNRLGKSRLSEDDVERLAVVANRYRGEFAAGLSLADAQPFEEWMLLQRIAFHQQALHVCDVLITAYENRGMIVEAQRYARQSLALEPWREEAHLHLIRLLASNDQKSEALAQVERCRQLLLEEMGMEPGEEIRALAAQIRAGQYRPVKPSDTPLPHSRLHRFPAQFTSFLGRDAELQTIIARLRSPDCRMVTLVGAGGVGKTRLSVQSAQRLGSADGADFEDGLYFVDCAPLTRVEDLPSIIAITIDLVLQGGTPATDQIYAFLRDKSLLLVLDNVEQIIGCAADLASLLAACPRVKMLVTSREPLHIRAEWRYDIEGLETRGGIESKAAQLFIQRARQVVPGFTPTAVDAAAIQQTVESIGGHPLAIELAATWLRLYDCRTIADEIARGLGFLETTLRDVPSRHRSMRVLFDHSWHLLTSAEQKTLRQLSVLRGEWTLPQGTAVANGTPRVLVTLADKSLIRRTHAGRYAIDELIRQFAFEHLEQDTEWSEVQTRCVTFFLRELTRHRAALTGMEPQSAVAALRADWINIRHAWTTAIFLRLWNILEAAIESYQMFIELTGFVADGLADLQALLEQVQSDPREERLTAIANSFVAGWFFQRAHYDRAHDHARRVLALPDTTDVAQWRGNAWYIRANSDLVQGRDMATIFSYMEQAAAYFDRAGDRLGQAKIVALYATVAQKQGAADKALSLHSQALAQFEALHYPLGIMQTLSHIGVTYRRSADYHQALAYHLRCLEIAEKLNSPAELARHHNNIGVVYRALQAYEQAIDHFSHAMEIDERIGHQRGLAIEKGNLGLIYQELFRYDEALTYFGEAVEIARAIGLRGVEANYLACRGELYADVGQFDIAIREIEDGITVARSIENHTIAATYTGILAWVYFCGGNHARGMALIDRAIDEQLHYKLREALAHSLYFKARMLSATRDYVAALDTVEEALALRTEIGVAGSHVLKLEVLRARLQARLGWNAQAITALNTLLESNPPEELHAEILFGLAEISRTGTQQRVAIALIESLYARNPRHEYRVQLAELRAMEPLNH